MKRLLLTAMLMLVMCSGVFAADYIRVGVDSIAAGTQNAQIPFCIERTCLVPTKLGGATNGFRIYATGAAGFTYDTILMSPNVPYWLNMYQGFPSNTFAYGLYDFAFLTGGLAMDTIQHGIPIVNDTLYFTLVLDLEPGTGSLYIDSALFPPAAWKFSNLTCGLGGAPDRPLFVDKYGSDANHPIEIVVYGTPKPEITNCPDTIDANQCNIRQYQFEANPGNYSGASITGWTKLSGLGSIDQTGLYNSGALSIGTHSVTVVATNNHVPAYKDTCQFYVMAETEKYPPKEMDFIDLMHNTLWGPEGAESLSVTIVTPSAADEELTSLGIKFLEMVPVSGERWYSATVTVVQFKQLLEASWVRHVIPSERGTMKFNSIESPVLDTSTAYMFADSARARTGLTGAGVIIGVIDYDFDPCNLDFAWGLLNYKVLNFWDQQCTTACSPPQGYTYGIEYTKERFDSLLYADVDTDEDTFHGTLVASVAAGTGGLVQPKFQFRLNQYTPQHDALVSPFSPEP
jgi:hypothetical protein